MTSQNINSLRLAMEEPWYKEYWTFLMVPGLATLACYFIPLFHGEQGMNIMAILPLTAAFSYGHTLSPRKPYYEKSWKKILVYHEFILASVKRALLFAVPTGLIAWIAEISLKDGLKELAMIFEAATWGLAVGILLYSLISYSEETIKLKKVNQLEYQANLRNLWKWIVLPTIAFLSLTIAKSYLLLELVKGRP